MPLVQGAIGSIGEHEYWFTPTWRPASHTCGSGSSAIEQPQLNQPARLVRLPLLR
jgi:hypothetical protein